MKTSRQQKTNLVVQYSPSSASSDPTVVNTQLLYLAPKSSSKISELSGQLLYMLFHVFTLCTSTYFASTSHVVEHVAQVNNLQHIQQATSRLLLLYFTSQKGDMQMHRQDLFEKAQVKATSANNKLGGPLPPNSELLEPAVVYTKISVSRPKVVYTKLLYLARKYTELLYLARMSPPVRIVRVVPLSLGISLGLSNRHDGQGSMRHHAELWNQRLQNGCTGESIKIQLFNLRSQVVEFALLKKWESNYT